MHIDDRPVAFAGVIPLPVSAGSRKGEAIFRVSRLVTLPDWQGLGLAFVLTDALGSAYGAIDRRFRTYPAHPALSRAFDRSDKWQCHKELGTLQAGARNASSEFANRATAMGVRPCAVYEYVGPTMDPAAARRLLALG